MKMGLEVREKAEEDLGTEVIVELNIATKG